MSGWLGDKRNVFLFLKKNRKKRSRREEKRCGVCVYFRSELGKKKKRRRRGGARKRLEEDICMYLCTSTKREGGKGV